LAFFAFFFFLGSGTELPSSLSSSPAPVTAKAMPPTTATLTTNTPIKRGSRDFGAARLAGTGSGMIGGTAGAAAGGAGIGWTSGMTGA